MITRLWSLIRKEFIQIVRDPRTLAITFVMPVVQMLLLGYSATNDVRNVPLAVWDQSRSVESRTLLDAYRAADYFRVTYEVDGETAIRDLIDKGSIRAAIIIPPDYADALARGDAAQVAFVIDGSDPTIAGTALSAATLIGQSRSTALMIERLAARGQSGALRTAIDVRTQVLFNPDLVSAYYMVPALVGLILQYLTVVLTSGTIVRERERGTIEQLIVTPIRSWELVVGKLTPYIFIAFFDSLEVLVVGKFLFDVPINGNLFLLLTLTALFLATTLGLGLLISTMANTQQEATMSSIFVLLPSIFLSGFFYPLAAMPPVLQWVSYMIPLRYFLVVVRGITLKGIGLESLWFEVVALAVFAVVIMGGAALRFRKRLD